jgi:hypothetical protein
MRLGKKHKSESLRIIKSGSKREIGCPTNKGIQIK